jgi:hypothetical protein
VCGGKTKPKVDDQVLKTRIIARYSYIDQAESSREHRPVAPKQVSTIYINTIYHIISNFNVNLFEHLILTLFYFVKPGTKEDDQIQRQQDSEPQGRALLRGEKRRRGG